MKTRKTLILALLGFLALNSQFSTVFAQGSLTPPAAPGPSMVTLAQIEPRTPISGFFTITNPGSYYLTTNITCNLIHSTGIGIVASGVTLDLNGFTIASTANYSVGAGAGGIELVSGLSDITIRNGHIRGGVTYSGGTYSEFGFGDGINYSGTAPVNVRVSGVTVSGCIFYGINLGTTNSTIVEDCTVQTVGGYGIQASCVFRSTACQCGNNAITANIASDSYGYSTTTDGIHTSFTANNCYGLSSGDEEAYGVYTASANNCYGQVTGWGGYEGNAALLANTATGCTGQNASSIGLASLVALNCYGDSAGDGGVNDNPSICGLSAEVAQGCLGQASTGYGMETTVAIGCIGDTSGGGLPYGLTATIANSCSSSGGDADITYKYNMP